MGITGKIKTLFSDRENTEALFPRTKISAVSDEEGTGLNVILESMVHVGDFSYETEVAPINADALGGILAEDFATKTFVRLEVESLVDAKVEEYSENFVTKTEEGMAALFASGRMILSSNQYGNTLPDAGIAGRVFFKKVSG